MHGRTQALAGTVVALSVLACAAPAGATFPGRNGRLIYADHTGAISTLRADGTHPRHLITLPGATHPAWSADGRQIVFAARVNPNRLAYNSYEIYTMRADGSHLVRRTHNSVADLSPSWSRTGHSIALVRVRFDKYYNQVPESAQLRLLSLASGHERLVVDGFVREARLSPDGKLIAYSTGKDVFVVRATGGSSRLVAHLSDAYLNGDLTWEPYPSIYSGGSLAFTDYNDAGPCDEICTHGVWSVWGALFAFLNPTYTPNAPNRITPFGEGQTRAAIWSPDARKIDYCVPHGAPWVTPGWYIATMHPDGTHAHPVAPISACLSDWQALPPEKKPKR